MKPTTVKFKGLKIALPLRLSISGTLYDNAGENIDWAMSHVHKHSLKLLCVKLLNSHFRKPRQSKGVIAFQGFIHPQHLLGKPWSLEVARKKGHKTMLPVVVYLKEGRK